MFSRQTIPVGLRHTKLFREVNSSPWTPSKSEQRNDPRWPSGQIKLNRRVWKHSARINQVWEAAKRAHNMPSPPPWFSWDTHPWGARTSEQSPWQVVDVELSLWTTPHVNKMLSKAITWKSSFSWCENTCLHSDQRKISCFWKSQ